MKNILKILVFSLVAIVGLSSFNNLKIESETIEDITSQRYELMLGEFTLEELKATKNKKWFESNYKTYKPDEKVLTEIKEHLKNNNFNIEIYLGTWCPDSRREFPRMIKILNESNFDIEKLKIVGVNRDKVVPEVSEEKREILNVNHVPTIIFYKDGKEINRFVEFAQENLESDVLKIVSGQDYKHSYEDF
ncbi:thioredoxin family protein [Psychroflexus aestuariivivens]|uniref:thioredoxin family protein n=1 Tax=Psychroflexus aestuariivivens TaxID=1795040 RepID=UPI000FD7905F|nr:thioredoxin family protein [Psychroflexus aestuariivivens]